MQIFNIFCQGKFWPAVLLGIDQISLQAFVDYIGKIEVGCVQATDCFLMSEQDPNVPNNGKIEKYVKANNSYIAKLRRKYDFKFADFNKELDPANIQLQLHAMLPGLKTNTEFSNQRINTNNQNLKRSRNLLREASSPNSKKRRHTIDAKHQDHTQPASRESDILLVPKVEDGIYEVSNAEACVGSSGPAPRVETPLLVNISNNNQNHSPPVKNSPAENAQVIVELETVLKETIDEISELKIELAALKKTIETSRKELDAANMTIDKMKDSYGKLQLKFARIGK